MIMLPILGTSPGWLGECTFWTWDWKALKTSLFVVLVSGTGAYLLTLHSLLFLFQGLVHISPAVVGASYPSILCESGRSQRSPGRGECDVFDVTSVVRGYLVIILKARRNSASGTRPVFRVRTDECSECLNDRVGAFWVIWATPCLVVTFWASQAYEPIRWRQVLLVDYWCSFKNSFHSPLGRILTASTGSGK